MSKEIFVAFATQKGGIGKSTVTALAASYLHNVKGYNVAVVDCDNPQYSICGLREHETELIGSSTYFKALACDHFRKIKKNAYTIIKSDAVNALDDAERMIAGRGCKTRCGVLRYARNTQKQRRDKDTLADGLHLRTSER